MTVNKVKETMGKIVSKKEFHIIREALKKENKKIVLCHGVFDLLHVGHIHHFEEAKAYGDILVVSVTSSNWVRKGPDRPYFDDEQRTYFLSSINTIDYVILSTEYTVEDIVEVVKPDIYVKGEEYQNAQNDVTGKIDEEKKLVEKYGGKICFTSGETFSSTQLINRTMPVFSDEMKCYLHDFCGRHTKDEVLGYVECMRDKKILVLGDVIIDDYIFCKIQGIMSKNMGYSARFIKEEKYLGGSIAIARHIAEFCDHVGLLSVMGDEKPISDLIDQTCTFDNKIIKTSDFDTIIKKRYVEPDDKRKNLDKIFVINNLSDSMAISQEAGNRLKKKLKEIISEYDAVFLCDFGHGLIDDEVKEIVEKMANKIILNCQTNSSNFGLNLITKYNRADYFTLDEKELRLAYSDYSNNNEKLLMDLTSKLNGKGCLTTGSKGCVFCEDEELKKCPAFVLDVSDTIGAGDAFYSMFGLMAIADAPLELCAFMGNLVGALATNIIGNKEPVKRADILKYMCTLLNI